MHRRQFLAASGLAAAAWSRPVAVLAAEQQAGADAASQRLLEAFVALPGTKSAQVDIDGPLGLRRIAYQPDSPLFCGSCFKTFVLATYLQGVEAGTLSESEQLAINDSIRSVGGGVFEFLTGTASARTVLEAMIAHSDNTATDVAMLRVGVDKVRAFIEAAGLKQARIPDSTRRFFSYLAGYSAGTDMGWAGLQAVQAGRLGGPSRPAINDRQTMVCPASELVAYYKRALAGEFFRKKETLTEFKRIQAMADAIPLVVPADTAAYAKGGSIGWDGFHCLAVAGQMIVGTTPATFCLTLNWTDRDGSEAKQTDAYRQAVADALGRARREILRG
jgi:beta-lactamase class A